ncbi:MAG TPA: hypothetical protein VJ124_00520, partial [Pyrinomonadaceae bacterium]|nr:hypothetical protein [Pyrinomonadaceae bacterium]
FGEKVEQTDLGPQLTHEQTIRTPRVQRRWIGAQDIGDDPRITLVGVGIRLAVAPTSTLNRAGWNDEHVGIPLIPDAQASR